MRDKDRFDADREAGDRHLAAGDMDALRECLRAMWRNKISEPRRGDVGTPADVMRE